ncbi:hypothetical protein [Boudabousia marimammalium]|nr:hypothetical protein [Boudabousia marimammalium]
MSLVRFEMARFGSIITAACNSWLQLVKAQDWDEIKLFPDGYERKKTAAVGWFLLLILVSVLGISVIVIVSILLDSKDISENAFRSAASFNILYISTICTVAVLCVVAFGLLAQWKGIVRFRLDMRSAGMNLANTVGFFAAAGAASAAVSPLLIDEFSPGRSTVGPVILVEFPALFAVMGYIVGVIYVPFSFCKQSNNLFYRWWIPGIADIVGFTFVVYGFQLDPRHLFAPSLQASGVTKELCSAPVISPEVAAHVDDPVWLTAMLDLCGGGAFVSENQITIGVLLYVVTITLAGTLHSYLRVFWSEPANQG